MKLIYHAAADERKPIADELERVAKMFAAEYYNQPREIEKKHLYGEDRTLQFSLVAGFAIYFAIYRAPEVRSGAQVAIWRESAS